MLFRSAQASGVSPKEIKRELQDDIYHPLFDALSRIRQHIEEDRIQPQNPSAHIRERCVSQVLANLGRPVRAAFLPMKGDPRQLGHLFVLLEGIATAKLDKVVVMVDNGDPRKPNLTSLTVREAITKALLNQLGCLVQYTPLPKEHEELFKADGETVLFKLISLNADIDSEFYYMVGSDHRYWISPKNDKPDTTYKLYEHQRPGEANVHRFDVQRGYYGYKLGISPKLNLIFIERKGEPLTKRDIRKLHKQSGIDIQKIFQPMDLSSSRLREKYHYWTIPWEMMRYAESFKRWGFEAETYKDNTSWGQAQKALSSGAVAPTHLPLEGRMMEETISRDSWTYQAATQRHHPNFPTIRDVRFTTFYFPFISQYQNPFLPVYSDLLDYHVNQPKDVMMSPHMKIRGSVMEGNACTCLFDRKPHQLTFQGNKVFWGSVPKKPPSLHKQEVL